MIRSELSKNTRAAFFQLAASRKRNVCSCMSQLSRKDLGREGREVCVCGGGGGGGKGEGERLW